jgi:hypothetical protein
MRKTLVAIAAFALINGMIALAQFQPPHGQGGPIGSGGPFGPGGPQGPGGPGGPALHDPPQTPEELAERCIHRLNVVANYTRVRMHIVTNIGVNLINHAQANNQNEHAETIAANRTSRVNHIAEFNTNRLEHILEHCMERLVEMGATEELLTMVQETAEAKVAEIEERRNEELQRIANALED